MKSKAKFVFVFCVLLVMTFSITPMAFSDDDPDSIRIAGGGMGGAWYLGASKLATFVQNIWEDKSASSTPGVGTSNLVEMESGKYQIAFTFTSAIYPAQKGKKPFEKEIENMQFVASTNPAYVIATGQPDIKKFGDLEGKRINGGPFGGSGFTATMLLVEEYGFDTKNVIGADYDKMPGMHFDNAAAAGVVYGSIPHIVPNEILTREPKSNILPISEEVRDAITERNPGYIKIDIPSESFKNQNKPVPTFGSMTAIVARPDLSEEFVYKLLKYTWEHKEELIDAHSVYKQFTKERVGEGRTIDWHPGAKKFWKEVGAID